MKPALAATMLLAAASIAAESTTDPEDWEALFNGRDLHGWTAKIRRYAPGDNFADTFRVQEGLLTVSYDGYETFDERFGHLFHDTPLSHYRLRLEYRFIGEQAPQAPAWALRNSGVMLHAQPPQTMPAAQDFPISLEFQFLGGLDDGEPRPTGSLCTPGTQVQYAGKLDDRHCIVSSGPTIDGDQWVRAEALVLGKRRIVHFIDGDEVIEYAGMTIGGGVVSGHDPQMKSDGKALGQGHIALQSEGHPIQFRSIEVLNLKGCMEPSATNFRSYYVEPDPAACY